MTAATPPEPQPSLPRRFAVALVLGTLTLAAVAVAISTGGCGRTPTPPNPGDDPAAGPKVDAWKVAGSRLRKETDLPTCKAALGGLRAEEGKNLPALSDEATTALAA